MLVLLRLPQALASGKDQVGAVEQVILALHQTRRSELEKGKLVHAVVNGQLRAEMMAESEPHRRVVPADVFRDLLVRHKGVEQLPELTVDVFLRLAARQMGCDHLDAALLARTCLQPRFAFPPNGLFPEINSPSVARESADQMLRPLVHESPAQMRKTQQVCG